MKEFLNIDDIEVKEMDLLLRNELRHKDLIKYLLKLLDSNNISIQDKEVIDYLENMDAYDSLYKDYRKEE